MLVTVCLPDVTLRDIDDLAHRKGISRTETLIQCIETTYQVAQMAPHGAIVKPMTRLETRIWKLRHRD
jgi:hypothetical protein